MPHAGIHAFPSGMRAGTCLHEILEEVGFRGSRERARDRASAGCTLTASTASTRRCSKIVRALADAAARRAKTSRFALADVPNESRMAELEFSFPVDCLNESEAGARFSSLPSVCAAARAAAFPADQRIHERLHRSDFRARRTLLFRRLEIELARADTRAYRPAAIATEMQRNFYTLQLCLYSVALHRYLRVRKRGL